MAKPDFDVDAAHNYFSADCFNRAWDLIDKTDRTPEEDEQMIRLNQASIWHWTQRPDCTPKNLSVGYWQASRIYALLGQAENARRYGRLSLQASQSEGVPPFFRGYAWEALARAEMVGGEHEEMDRHLAEARQVAEMVTDLEDKKQLLADLETIRPAR
jgi:hypothetical protein